MARRLVVVVLFHTMRGGRGEEGNTLDGSSIPLEEKLNEYGRRGVCPSRKLSPLGV